MFTFKLLVVSLLTTICLVKLIADSVEYGFEVWTILNIVCLIGCATAYFRLLGLC